MAWLRTALRRFRTDRVPAIGLATLVFATALVFALAPRILDRVGDEAIRREVAAAPIAERNLQLLQDRRIGPDARAPMSGVAVTAERLEEQLSAEVRTIVADRSYLAETTRWEIADRPTESFAILRFQPGAESRVRLVEGRLPAGTEATDDAGDPDLEVAIAVPSAEVLEARVGDVLQLSLDGRDRLNSGHDGTMSATVVGIYDVGEPLDPWFLGDDALAVPTIRPVSADHQVYDVTMLAAPSAYDQLMRATEDDGTLMRYRWAFHVDPERLESERAAQLITDLRRAETLFPSSSAAQAEGGTALRSGLLRILEAQQAAQQAVEAVLTVAATGPAFVALAALALVAILASERRRSTISLWRRRGASTGQVGGSAVTEGLLLAVPAAVLAAILAVAIVPTGPLLVTALAATFVAVSAILLWLWTARRGDDPERRRVGRRPSTRRRVLEGLVVVLAVLGAVLLRDRGIVGGAEGEPASADPFVALSPVLLGLAAAIVAMRIQPLVMRAAARVAATRADLVPVLGLRRATREIGSGPILLVLLVTSAIGVFSLAVIDHLDRAAEAASWQEVGAPFRLDRPDGILPASLDPATLPGVTAAAAGYRDTGVVTASGREAALLALDPLAFEAVVAGTPADVRLPAEMLETLAVGAPLPILVSTDQLEGRLGIAIGETTRVSIAGRYRDVVIVGAAERFPSLPVDGPWVVLARPQVETDRRLPTTTAYLRAPADAEPGLAEAAVRPGRILVDRADRAIELHGAPSIAAVKTGVTVVALVAAVYAAIALAAAFALTASARASEAALLRTLGVTERQDFVLQVAQHGPTVAISFILGAVLGLGAYVVLRPGLGLDAVVGSPVDVPPSVDLVGALLIAILVVIVATAAFGLAAIMSTTVAPVAAVRRAIE